MIQFDEHIFSKGLVKNHQPEKEVRTSSLGTLGILEPEVARMDAASVVVGEGAPEVFGILEGGIFAKVWIPFIEQT